MLFNQDRLKSLTRKAIEVLIVEDNPIHSDTMKQVFNVLPQAHTEIITSEDYVQFDTKILQGYTIVMIGGWLRRWEGIGYGGNGLNLIGPLKKVNPLTYVIIVSASQSTINEALYKYAADGALFIEDLLELQKFLRETSKE